MTRYSFRPWFFAWFALMTVNGLAAESVYSSLDLDQCDLVEAHEMGGRFLCKGVDGIDVHVAEGDLRFFVSYGPTGLTEPAMEQTLSPFNTIHEVLEWRGLPGAEGGFQPYATILRYFTDTGEGGEQSKGQVLVVTRLRPGPICQIAMIDARSNRNANELARMAADQIEGSFDCAAGEPAIVGASGKSPM